MSNSIIRLGYKDAAWFTANAAVILEQGQHVYLEQTGTYKIGDGVNDLATLTFLGNSSSGVQSVTGSQVDNTDTLNPIIKPLGLVKIIDLNGDFFTDLATANAYISTFTSATITDESFNNGVYYFTVPSASDFSNTNLFLSLGIFTASSAYIIDKLGLINIFSDSLCLNNSGNSVFGNISCGADSFTSSSGINTFNNLSSHTPSFVSTTGKFIFNGSVTATGIFLTDFFLTSTATILTRASNLVNTDLLQAAANGANVQYDGVNLATVNDLPSSFLDCVNGATTVTTVNTLSTSLLVPAGTFSVNDLIELKARGVKTGANGTFTIRIYVNSSNTISGATLLGSFNSSSNGNTQLTINRNGAIKSTTSTQFILSTANLGDDFIQTTISSINIDHTINQYYIVALQCGISSDSAVCSYFKITKH